MSSAVNTVPKPVHSWWKAAWFALLLGVCYGPVLKVLVGNWDSDPDMGHGFFVPLISGFIVWQKREELLALKPKPNWWGLAVVLFGGLQLIVATLGVELFLARTAFVITLIGVVWLLGGDLMLKKLAFPLFLLFFMIPIPAVIYNSVTFPLQILASQLADAALGLLNIPVMREGNILELPNQRLSVVEACSGIRSLLSLTFLSLVYGYFMEKRAWARAVLFLSTIPIAILANGSRVTITGILTQIKPEYAEGFFHESTGWVIFMMAFAILILFHQLLASVSRFVEGRRQSI
jgi:exosortase